jgi:hypothetical protein
LNILGFEDHGHVIAYIPSLKLSGYGETSHDAREMVLDVVLKDFLETITGLPEAAAQEEMNKLGWQKSNLPGEKFRSNKI